MKEQRFRDRAEAGRLLGVEVGGLGLRESVVLALPRGGVPVGFEVAAALGAPLDVIVARKVGAPHQPELGIGAVAENGVVVSRAAALRSLALTEADFVRLAATEREELDRRVRRYRGDRVLPVLADRDVCVVDDGLATGVTADAALRAVRALRPRRLVLAVPVCASATAERVREVADDVVCVVSSDRFSSVGQWYDDFTQTTDDEVLALLAALSED